MQIQVTRKSGWDVTRNERSRPKGDRGRERRSHTHTPSVRYKLTITVVNKQTDDIKKEWKKKMNKKKMLRVCEANKIK